MTKYPIVKEERTDDGDLERYTSISMLLQNNAYKNCNITVKCHIVNQFC